MFLVCGEALFDVFASGDTPTGVAFDGRVGGSPFNVAIGLARLSQPVSFFSGVSRGFLGERLMRTLAEERVGTATVQRSDAPTTLSLIGLDAAGVPSYSFYGDGAADRVLGADALALVPDDGVTALQLGSYAMVVEPVASTQRALVERLHRRCFVAYDPNIRLNVQPDLAPWREVLDWMLPRTRMLKVSDEDLGLLYPGRTLDDFAAGALAAGVSLVVVTRGSKGAIGWTKGVRVEAQPVVVKVIDTVGAGDTFQAALLTWLAEQARLSGEAAAAMSAEQLGDARVRRARRSDHLLAARGGPAPAQRGVTLQRRTPLSSCAPCPRG